MNLCFRLYTAVNKPECRYGKVKIFTVPVALSQRKFFAERCFINLNDPDAMSFKIQYFGTDGKCNLKDGFLSCNIFARERPVQNGEGPVSIPFTGFFERLCA